MKPIKVVHVIQTLSLQGGMQRVVTNLCGMLADKFDIEIWVFSSKTECFFELDKRIKLRFIGHNPDDFDGSGFQKGVYFFRKLFNGIITYKSFINQHKPDVIFIHRSEIDDVFMGFQHFFSKTMEVLHTPFNMQRQQPLSALTTIQRRFFYQFLQPKKNIIVPNNGIKKDMESAGWSNVRYISNFINIKCDVKATRERYIILAVGRNAPEKGFNLLVGAFRRLVKIHPNWELHFLGSNLQDLKNKTDVNIHLHPPAKNVEDVIALYKSASLFVLPSYYESTGLVMLEAMECGLPVVCAKINGLQDIAKEGCVLLFENGSEDDLFIKLDFIINHPNFQKDLVSNAIKHVPVFYPENVIPNWDKLIKEFVA